MKRGSAPRQLHPPRMNRLLEDPDQDPYRAREKPQEPTVCPECKAIFHRGRWCWGDAPPDAREELCPACHRERDNFPAGFLRLGGKFFVTHREEIMKLIEHIEQKEKQEHPLKRIIGIQNLDDSVLVTTTDIHLARGLGMAVQQAFQGKLVLHYSHGENLLRVNWLH